MFVLSVGAIWWLYGTLVVWPVLFVRSRHLVGNDRTGSIVSVYFMCTGPVLCQRGTNLVSSVFSVPRRALW
jgi:hypothetical protein